MLLTITERVTARAIRYVVECDGVRTHMLNGWSLEWHLKNKLMLNSMQCQQVFTEICNHGNATLELTAVEQTLSAVS